MLATMAIKNNDKTLSPFAAPTADRSKWRQALPQILAVCVKNVLLLGFGMTIGFPTILIPSLSSNNPDETFHLGQEAISWIGSINLICVPIGCLLSGAITQPIGRKRAMQFVNIPFVIAWLLLYFCNDIWQVYLALAITGLTGGLMEAPTITYVAEITQPNLRGILSSTAGIGVLVGIILEFLLGKFFPWRTVALISITVPILSLVCLVFLPESPHWLILKNRQEEAKISLAWFRGWVQADEVAEEFAELEQHAKSDKQLGFFEICRLLTNKNFLWPYLLVSFAFFLAQMSGTSPIQVYAVKIFAIFRSPIDEYYATVVMGISQLLGVIFSTCFVFNLGKRRMNFISLGGCGCCFLIIATHAYLNEINNLNQIHKDLPPNWLPTILLVLATFFSFMGIKLLPWLLIGEVYPNEIRAPATGITGATGYVFAFITNKTFFTLVSLLTLPGTFWFYSSICFSGFIILYFILPETEGRTLFEITEHFANNARLSNRVVKNRTEDSVREQHVNQAFKDTENDVELQNQ